MIVTVPSTCVFIVSFTVNLRFKHNLTSSDFVIYYRKQIPLDKNEGIYIQNVQNGQVCLVISTLRISFKDFFVSKTCKQMLNSLVLV